MTDAAAAAARSRAGRIAGALIGALPVAFVVAPPGAVPAAAIAATIAIGAALHGFGRLLAWLGDDEDAPAGLVLAWGLAGYLALAGALIALHAFGPAARAAIVVGGCVLNAGWLSGAMARLAVRRVTPRPAAIAATTFAVVVVGVMVLASAARWYGPFSDEETDYLGQLRRLDDTGGLDDAVGFPRAAGLGGQVALAALATPVDARAAHLVDRGLGFGLVVILLATCMRTRAARVGATALVPVVMTAVPEYLAGMAPVWSVVALVAAAAIGLERAQLRQSRRGLGLVVLAAAAAATLRHPALILLAWVATAAVLRQRRWPSPARWWRTAAAITAGVVAPYALAAVRAGLTTGGSVARVQPRGAAIGIAFALGLVAFVLTGLALGRRPGREVTLGACASLAAAGLLSPSLAATLHYGLAIGVAVLLLVGVALLAEPSSLDEISPGRAPFGAAVVLATAAVGGLAMAPYATGKPLVSWQTRTTALLDDARSLGDLPRAMATRAAAEYATAQHAVPPGARLGIWVGRADLVRYDTHAVIDLGGPRAPRTATGLAALRIDYVLVDRSAAPPDLGPFRDAHRIFDRAGLVVIALPPR